MKEILRFLTAYVQELRPFHFLSAIVFTAIAIFCNYYFQLHLWINSRNGIFRHLGWFLVFFIAFGFGYLIQSKGKKYLNNPPFLILLIIAPALFAWKMTANVRLTYSQNTQINDFWNLVLYWPIKLVVVLLVLFLIWKWRDSKRQPFYGFSTRLFHIRPYLMMLLLMVPLIAAASTQPDFLSMYPKLQHVQYLEQTNQWYHKLVFEIAYGLDFLSIETFFRGFLVLAFCRWAGKDVILPMAIFYCTIHFGKPVGECISSFFGGLILGVVTYHTASIYGGLIVHLGIAWLMELGGYLGNLYYNH